MNQDVYQFLLDQEVIQGASKVRDACRRYFKRRTYAGQLPESRKPIPKQWIAKAFAKQGGKCKRCGDEKLLSEMTGDHTRPLAKGGRHTQSNVTAMCSECNSRKGSNDLMEESKATGRTSVELLGDEV